MNIASLLEGGDPNRSSVCPAQQPPSASFPAVVAVTAPPNGPPPAPFAAAASSSSLGVVGGPGVCRQSVSVAPGSAEPLAAGSDLRPRSTTRKRNVTPRTAESPAKKRSKWSSKEDALLVQLRGSNMKWEDISTQLPGRSPVSCRLHYQNYLERRNEWSEELKNKLARVYERFKHEMWAKLAQELEVPWRAAEAMHWQLGEADLARRAGAPLAAPEAPISSPTTHHTGQPRGFDRPHDHFTATGPSSKYAVNPAPVQHAALLTWANALRTGMSPSLGSTEYDVDDVERPNSLD
ncbi:hypothetical protein N658DRAFT_488936 [Parathielavia hyrcaniae]|uniref:Uncharacterized protein n=1 Tax=Parathielavia hyrcaniae TaxID=113614 RepID=A0AAN6PVC7_9PEZI|nr:hypothetical protein N658DRAFT_488936 [Parathielavia hyrcaniae]